MIAHNGSGFDSYVVLDNSPKWRSVVKFFRKGGGIISLKNFNGYVVENKKILQYVLFGCGKIHIKVSLKKSVSYKLQSSLLKQEKEDDELYEDTWEARENEWLSYVKKDVLSPVFCYARCILGMEDITGFSMKNSITLPSLENKYFKKLWEENDEPIHTHTDPFMRNFVRLSIKGGRCNVFNQH